MKALKPRILALTAAIACAIGPSVLAEITGITVSPGVNIPVGVTAGYTATLNSNPPQVSGFAWAWQGQGCGGGWNGGGTHQTWLINENLVGAFTVRCIATHAGMPPPPPTTKTINVTVAAPSSDSISSQANTNVSLPHSGYPTPTVQFQTNTSAGVAGPYISGTFDRKIVDWHNNTTYGGVTRQGNMSVVQFFFMDPDNFFNTVADGQPFYQVTTTNRIAYVNQCRVQVAPKNMTSRTVKWIKVDSNHWKLTIQ